MMIIAVNALGWIGAAALLTAYWLVSTRRTNGDSATYQALNLVGGVLVLLNSLYYGAYPSVGVNAVWVAIGLFALVPWNRGDLHKSRRAAPGSQGATTEHIGHM